MSITQMHHQYTIYSEIKQEFKPIDVVPLAMKF